MRFNQSQSRAIDHFQGPCLVLAGPGSGKTAVITYRVKNLITKYHIPPEKILVLTFSKAAAEEMEERFFALRQDGLQQDGRPTFGTFHGFFLSVLRSPGGLGQEKILSTSEKQTLLRELAASLSIDQVEDTFWETLAGEISRFKCSFSSEPYASSSLLSPDLFFRLYDDYERALAKDHRMDFDDILCRTHELLSHRSDLLSALQERFSFLLIDEFQDVSLLQYAIMNLLAGKKRNLFAVGDDDQAIYAFRGASARIMQQFLNDFPDAVRILLNVNYRSNPSIIRSALTVISANKDRFRKDIHCFQIKDDPEAFIIYEEESLEAEYEHMAERICSFLKKGCQPETIAVLVRSTTDLPLLRSTLLRHGIRIRNPAFSDPSFDSFLCKDFTCYMKLAAALAGIIPESAVSRSDLLQILNKPSRFLSKQALDNSRNVYPQTIRDLFTSLQQYYSQMPAGKEQIRHLSQDLRFLSSCTPYAAICYIWNQIGYKNYIREFCQKNHRDPAEMEKIFRILTDASAGMRSFREWEALLQELRKQPEDADNSGIFVMTMHASKGLEFDIVFLPDLNEELLPHKKADTPELIQEERRLFYVAMTRAAKKLCLSYVRDYHNKKATRSRFLDCFF